MVETCLHKNKITVLSVDDGSESGMFGLPHSTSVPVFELCGITYFKYQAYNSDEKHYHITSNTPYFSMYCNFQLFFATVDENISLQHDGLPVHCKHLLFLRLVTLKCETASVLTLSA